MKGTPASSLRHRRTQENLTRNQFYGDRGTRLVVIQTIGGVAMGVTDMRVRIQIVTRIMNIANVINKSDKNISHIL